jgi:hypothetical protein
VTGNFGFLAPVLAKQSPAVLDSINQYSPVLIINGLGAIMFVIGYALFGVAMIRTATLPRWSGILVAVGAPAHLLGFGIAQLVSTAAWAIAIVGSVSFGVGLSWAGYRLWHRHASDRRDRPVQPPLRQRSDPGQWREVPDQPDGHAHRLRACQPYRDDPGRAR